ncbi:unnamed protein product [Caenorhabditis auriculariae]|uniref:Cation efflux protein cytoplasmic domain-containing protein n=1 Tax=Caenorhabditis auriculariae TaxID=2777116 RepID=A0A8S1HLV1_9PELO|nr:unnamed protein product [Caenorhabditis auriculariae]
MNEKAPLLNTDLNSNNYGYYGQGGKGSWLQRRRKRKAIKEYYEDLDRLTGLYEDDMDLMQGRKKTQKPKPAMDRYLARAAIILNLALVCANLTAAYLSHSLSIVSTFVDSLMDVTSGAILGVCLWLIENTNSFNYPRGRARLELLGVILTSILMGIANMVIIAKSISVIVSGDINPVVNLPTLAIVLGGSGVKAILMTVCFRRGSPSSVVLAMDMRNDIFTSLVGLTSAVIADNFWIYADPIGAIIVCGLIALSWFRHAGEYIPSLVGIRAERELLSRILKIVIEHDDRIKCVDHIMVYHTGVDALVELHIVLDENLPLKITHDISHPLEKKLARLEFVERAFVHCDYDCDGD